tara:strand:+ start:533 stop:1066 length:534 start_codon:yes stop_codon:yes gene_type:complete
MYLIHNTNLDSLNQILIEKKLKASYLTGKTNQGEGIYQSKDQKFVFFSVIDNLESKYKIYGDVILYFDFKLLWNRKYYLSTVHSASPDDLDTWNKGTDYKKKYNQYYKSTNKVLTKLFENAVSKLPKGKNFQAFQQVAILKQCNLKYLKKIKFLESKPTNKILNLIKNEYPNIILDY